MSPRKPAWRTGPTGADQHRDWLALVDVDGPFLSLPVLMRAWPNGMDRLESDKPPLVDFRDEHGSWSRKPAARHEAWLRWVLSELCQWDAHLVTGTELPGRLTVDVPEHRVTLRPWGALFAPKADRQVDSPLVLVHEVAPGTPLRAVPDDGWAASPVDRLATALRRLDVPIGVVTDGRWWALVWATSGSASGSGLFDAASWVEEPLLRDAFAGLLGVQRLVGVREEERLPALFADSLLAQEEITEALGTQVRRAVELLVQALSEERLEAKRSGVPDPLPESPREVYEAAVTVLMRVVFLLFAEERGLLPIDRDLYRSSYAVSVLLDELEERARDGEELLDDSTAAWHRLLAVSRAVHDGASFEDVRMPAYGGSLFRPTRFPWFEALDEAGALRLRVSDRVVLHLLRAVQVVTTSGQARRVSFREVDVEQIGYVYEGLLGYTARDTGTQVVLGLKGRQGDEPEIDLDHLEELAENASTPTGFAEALIKHIDSTQPGSKAQTKNQIAKAYASEIDEAEVRSGLAAVCQHDEALVQRVLPFVPLLRLDLRGLPYVVPAGGLVVAETASRRNAGAHYTPRALAEEVVLHALEPLVYSPGPLQTANLNQWELKGSSEILDLQIADIAAGSGAFLVAAARYLAARLVEAWRAEEAIPDVVRHDGDGAEDPLTRLAIREVIARCLYGADINEMAVEMCKLSLWLVSLDPDKPFSFVDDKILLGNSLVGLTLVDQLRGLHNAPSAQRLRNPGFTIDVEEDLEKAAKLRREIASSPVDDLDPQRSAAHKAALLEQTHEVTSRLRDVADGVIAAGLALGGKPGKALDAAYENLSLALLQAYPPDGSEGDRTFLDAILQKGLAPTVPTDYERWEPLHWIVEVPDVMERGGFDAVIGNPPFLGGKKLSPALGANVRGWFVWGIAGGVAGNADLVAYFVLRAFSLLMRESGQLGLIATNSVAQGDTREVGLAQVVNDGLEVRRCIRSASWPSHSANLEYAAVWGSRQTLGREAERVIDGLAVASIAPSLEPSSRVQREPVRLAANKGLAFMGSNVNGMGFTMPPAVAAEMVQSDSRNADVLLPFLGGADLNSDPACKASRWIVNFRDWPEERIRSYVKPYEWISGDLRRHRESLKSKPHLQDQWWVYEARAQGLYDKLETMDEVIALAATSRSLMPDLVPSAQVFAHSLVLFASDDPGMLALLNSSVHALWAIQRGSGLRGDPRYTPTDVFQTFPRCDLTEDLRHLGMELHTLRRRVMSKEAIGLTGVYNRLITNPVSDSEELGRLRQVFQETDLAVLRAYGWSDLSPEFGVWDYKGVLRFGADPATRTEILDRLLELNVEVADGDGALR